MVHKALLNIIRIGDPSCVILLDLHNSIPSASSFDHCLKKLCVPIPIDVPICFGLLRPQDFFPMQELFQLIPYKTFLENISQCVNIFLGKS
jgi:hypothetical protein